MNRQMGIVGALVAVLLVALFYFFVWRPKSDEIDEVNAQIETVEQQQAQLQQRLTELRDVRNSAPELEAAIVAAESIVPRDIGQASAIRQLQLAADEAGADLETVGFTQPQPVADAPAGLAAMDVNVSLTAGYYQLVDFFRRVEDPTITPRGIVWHNVSLAPSDYPTLTASSTGSMFALLPTPPEPAEEPSPEAPADEAEVEQEVVEEEAG